MSPDFDNLKKLTTTIRRDIITMLTSAKSGHTGGSLGMVEILVALYFEVANVNPKKPLDPKRDRIILSHGHTCPALYATLARRGYFPVVKLMTLRKLGSALQGHPERGSPPGIETSTGPLGQGIAVAVGMALAAKIDKSSYHVFCLMSDGELDEGSSWEAFMFAAKEKLDNLTIVIDRNSIQLSGNTESEMPLEPLAEKFKSFNLRVKEIDGHNLEELIATLKWAKEQQGRPTVLLARTVLGKGVSFMENDFRWHGKAPNKEEAERASRQINRWFKLQA